MKGGVRINNYVDNRVVVTGRKVRNEVQAAVQSHRPRPLIIHHINYIEPEQLEDRHKSPNEKRDQVSGKKRRKRTKTVHIKNNQQSRPISRKNRASVSLEHLKKAMTSEKKNSASSSPSKQSEKAAFMNQTIRKMKPIYKSSSTTGLGKRSKSAIIKTNRSPERANIKVNEKNSNKKNSQKQSHLNHAKKQKKNQSINIGGNKRKTKKKQNIEKQKVSTAKAQPSSVNSSIKKVGSAMNLQLNKKKISNESTSRVSARKTNRNTSKTTSAKQSKPISARQNRRTNIKKKLFDTVLEDQTQIMDQKRQVEHINLSSLLANHESDQTVKKMINQLQMALNTIGSRKKITKDLQIITQSVKALANKREESEQQDQSQEDESMIKMGEEINTQMVKNIQIKEGDGNGHIRELEGDGNGHIRELGTRKYQQILDQGKNEVFNSGSSGSFDSKQKAFKQHIEEYDLEDQNQEVVSNQQGLEESPEDAREDQQVLYDERLVNQEQEQEDDDEMMELERKRRALHKQLFEDEEEIQESQKIKQNFNEKEDHQIYERIDPGFIDNQRDSNPLLDRRGFGEMDMSEYDSIKSQQDQRQSEISLLKKFQQESDLMMKKVHKKLQIQVQSQIKQDANEPNKQQKEKVKTPINTQAYTFDRFPSSVPPQIQALKSPKFSQNQIVEVIKLKQKIMTDRHEKLGQLVNTLYSKHLVSPKTYSLHLNSLQRKYEQENQILDHHRKHAEQLAKLLSDIKKERQEIHGIDELIRGEKWQEAMGVIKSQQPLERPKLPRQQSVRDDVKDKFQDDLEDGSEHESVHEESASEQQSPLYYEGEVSDQANDSILKLVPIEKEQSSEQNEDDSSKRSQQIESSLIKIDQSNFSSVKQQQNNSRGFDSNLFFIKEYCISLCEFVRDNYKAEFKKNLSYPIQYDLDELLSSFRTLHDGSSAQRINSLYQNLKYHSCMRKEICPPISEMVFDEFNKSYENIKFYGKKQTQDAALQGIFLRSIFNALNESIGMQRPGSLQGKALPWAHSSKHLKNLKNAKKDEKSKNQQEEDMIFGIAVARIIQWGSCLCGFIPDTVDLQNTEIDEQYINHIRQTRMALLLQKMLADEQTEMSLTQLEQTQVNLQLSDIIYQEVMKEAASQIRKIQTRNALRMVDY